MSNVNAESVNKALVAMSNAAALLMQSDDERETVGDIISIFSG